MRWWRNRRTRSVAAVAEREVDTIGLLYAGRFDDAADQLNEVSLEYADMGDYPGAARALVRRVDPLLNALRMGELGADSFRLGDMVSRIPTGLRQDFDDFRDASSGKHDEGTPLAARTVLEGLVYLELILPGQSIDHARHVSGSRAGDVFFLRYHPSRRPPVRMRIPVGPVAEASFGHGRSSLVDAGQWVALAGDWTAMVDQADPETAARLRPRIQDAYRQALAFVPRGEEEVAGEGVWTPASRANRRARPESFRRSWLQVHLDAP